MANNYLQFSELIEHLTDKEYDWCSTQLAKLREDYEDDWDNVPGNFEYELSKANGTLWLYSAECCDPEHVAKFVQKFLKLFRPQECFCFNWAETCSKMRPGEFSGGGAFVSAEKIKFFIPQELAAKEIKLFEKMKKKE